MSTYGAVSPEQTDKSPPNSLPPAHIGSAAHNTHRPAQPFHPHSTENARF